IVKKKFIFTHLMSEISEEKIVITEESGTTSKETRKEQSGVELIEQKHVENVEALSPELEELIKTDPRKGLSTDEVQKRLEQFGRNELAE
ncbi:13828_t:CDS:1, partial [Racocetra persica]